jgi:hypothetical protein
LASSATLFCATVNITSSWWLLCGCRIGAILGLGLAYAGSHREELCEVLAPLVGDPDVPMVSELRQ